MRLNSYIYPLLLWIDGEEEESSDLLVLLPREGKQPTCEANNDPLSAQFLPRNEASRKMTIMMVRSNYLNDLIIRKIWTAIWTQLASHVEVDNINVFSCRPSPQLYYVTMNYQGIFEHVSQGTTQTTKIGSRYYDAAQQSVLAGSNSNCRQGMITNRCGEIAIK